MVFEIQAHRGARSFFPENTIPAFCKAAGLGIRVIELDVLVSGDREVLVSHDPRLGAPLCSDPSGMPLAEDDLSPYVIFDMAYREIAAFDCGRPHPSFPSQQQIRACKPLLRDVFRSVDTYMLSAGLPGKMIFNIEIKSWPDKDDVYHPEPSGYAQLIMDVVASAGFSDRVRIQSFDYRVVREAWKMDAGLCYGLLVNESEHIFPFLDELGFVPHYLNPRYLLVSKDLVGEMHARGIMVIPWTVNSSEEMLEMKRLGADGLITDYPERAIGLQGLVG
jgi:glycerophosphoryl diester phosphodiesterase